MTPAQRLLAQHAAAEAHQPAVEDVVDEDDLAHPPPSAIGPPVPESSPSRRDAQDDPALSSKAAGKQRATNDALNDTTNTQKAPNGTKTSIDTRWEEAFPSLAAPKVASQASSASMWGKKPPSVGSGPATAMGSSSAAAPKPLNSSSNVSQGYSFSGVLVLTQRRRSICPGSTRKA